MRRPSGASGRDRLRGLDVDDARATRCSARSAKRLGCRAAPRAPSRRSIRSRTAWRRAARLRRRRPSGAEEVDRLRVVRRASASCTSSRARATTTAASSDALSSATRRRRHSSSPGRPCRTHPGQRSTPAGAAFPQLTSQRDGHMVSSRFRAEPRPARAPRPWRSSTARRSAVGVLERAAVDAEQQVARLDADLRRAAAGRAPTSPRKPPPSIGASDRPSSCSASATTASPGCARRAPRACAAAPARSSSTRDPGRASRSRAIS